MGGLINGRTPEEIKRVLNGCDTLLCSECIYFKISKCDQRVFRDALALINHLESERDAVPVVHARWIDPCINKYGHPCHHCSACRFKASQKDRNYCPNCGARMDEKEND